MPYQWLADAVLLVHAAVVLFVVGGLVVILAGHLLRRWAWVDAPAFRVAHLVAIGVVVAQAWWGQVCVLTTLESWLRTQAGSPSYRRSFIEHWLQRMIYLEAPPWAFTLAYTLFALAVLLSWWRFPPRWKRMGPGCRPHPRELRHERARPSAR